LGSVRLAEIIHDDVEYGEEGVHIEHKSSAPFPSGVVGKPTLTCGRLPLKSSPCNSHQAFKEPYTVVYGPSDYLTDRELERVRALYSGELTMMDRWLGHFLDKMEELNLFENTLLIVVSDHGVSLGEHGMVGKLPIAMYPELTDTIFLMRHPEGKGTAVTSDYYASTHDVAPTILSLLGIEVPEYIEGQNLLGLVDGRQPAPRSHFTLGYHDHAWCRDEDYAMFCRHDGTEAKLFDVRTDPKMNRDIAGQLPGITKRMFEQYVIKDAGGPLPSY
jgi:arylsulfatase A-like enzyme